MKRLLILAVLFLMARPVSAQGDLLIIDETDTLNNNTIAEAADPLLNREARVAVYLISGGGEGDLLDNLRTDQLIDDSGRLHEDAIIVYFSFDPDFNQIRYGDRWRSALDGRLPEYEQIYMQTLLNQRDYQAAIESALSSIESAIVLEESEGQIWYIYLVIAGVGLAFVFAFVRMVYMVLRGVFKLGRKLSS